MRVVADVHTLVSGLLWHGAPRLVLEAARAGTIDLFTSAALLAELEEVFTRENYLNNALKPACSKCRSPVSASVMPRRCITTKEVQSVRDQSLSGRSS